jgi:hypothetical protein
MIDVLVRALVQVTVFLEFSDESTVDPSAAVSLMETLSAELQELSDEQRRVVVDEIVNLARGLETPQIREFVADLPGAMGLM